MQIMQEELHINWDTISREGYLSEELIRKYSDKINWDLVSIYQLLSENFIREFSHMVNWYNVSIHQNLSEEFVEECISKNKGDLINLIRYQKLSETFIRNNANYLDWHEISRNQQLSESFINEFYDKIVLYELTHNKSINASILKKFITSDKIKDNFLDFLDFGNFNFISYGVILTEDIIFKLKDRLDWDLVCEYQALSEELIEYFLKYDPNKISWDLISRCQKLSEEFIRKFQHKVNWKQIALGQCLSDEFIQEFADKLDKYIVFERKKPLDNLMARIRQYKIVNRILNI